MIKVAMMFVVLCCAGVVAVAADNPGAQMPASATAGSPAATVDAANAAPLQLRQRCVEAMNADPAFASSIVATVDRQIDSKTLAAHVDADYHIRKNERHVVYAYAAMWLIAVAFVWFLFSRQVALQKEIQALRRDLEAAAKEPS